MKYNKYYEFDIKKFDPLDYIPKANLHFTVQVENLNETYLKIQLYKGDKINFKLKVSGFYQLPTESEIDDEIKKINELNEDDIFVENDHIIYTYKIPTLKKQDKIKYLVFSILNNEPMHYLSLYTYPFKEEGNEKFTIYNINYKKEEILNKTTLSQHKGIFLFILENEDLENNKLVRLKIKKELSEDMHISAVAYKERPIKEEIILNPVSKTELPIKSLTKDEKYVIYEFLIENADINKQKYIAIAFLPRKILDFISFYIGPES
jgi:hypothetical protein